MACSNNLNPFFQESPFYSSSSIIGGEKLFLRWNALIAEEIIISPIFSSQECTQVGYVRINRWIIRKFFWPKNFRLRVKGASIINNQRTLPFDSNPFLCSSIEYVWFYLLYSGLEGKIYEIADLPDHV